jgi:predicted acylesterase/phospholipase RssA
MSGGGTYGSYEAGALWGMFFTNDTTQNRKKFEYHVVTGISAGSINIGGLALFPIGYEGNAIRTLSERWALLTTPEIYTRWKPLGLITGLFTKSGLFDTRPLETFLENFFSELGGNIYRKIGVGTVDTNTGNYIVYNENDAKDIIKGIMSSAAIPTIFPNI